MTSYQKLKAKNAELMQDIYTMVMKPDTAEGMTVKMRYKLSFQTEVVIWSGDATMTWTSFDGILPQIENNAVL